MSIEAARAYLQQVKRGTRSVARDFQDRHPYDCETVLLVVAHYGAMAGYEFSDAEYRAAATEEVEALLGSGELPDEGDFIALFHDLVDDGGDFLVFRRGAREEYGAILCGAHYANLVGGSVR